MLQVGQGLYGTIWKLMLRKSYGMADRLLEEGVQVHMLVRVI